jgi:hypothetical protein
MIGIGLREYRRANDLPDCRKMTMALSRTRRWPMTRTSPPSDEHINGIQWLKRRPPIAAESGDRAEDVRKTRMDIQRLKMAGAICSQ